MNYIPPEKEKNLTLSWFYDEIPEEYREVRKYAQGVEQEYLELRQLLKETLDHLQTHDPSLELQSRAGYLKKRLAELEKKFPWLTAEQFLEYALWGVPH
jgi:hypothetical protein